MDCEPNVKHVVGLQVVGKHLRPSTCTASFNLKVMTLPFNN